MLQKYMFSSDKAHDMDCREHFNKMFCVDFSFAPCGTRLMRGSLVTYRGRGISLTSLDFSPHTASMGNGFPEKAPALFVSLQKKGETSIKQSNRACTVQPGDIFMFDPGSPFSLETSDTHVYTAHIPMAALQRHVPNIENLTAIRIKGTDGTGALLRVLLDELFDIAPKLDQNAIDRATNAIPYIVSTAVLSLAQYNDVAPSRMSAFHKSRILSFIDANLRDPALDVYEIARAVNLSPRYIYQLFEREDTSLMRGIWVKRLEQCRIEIASPALKNKTISEVAYSWGFSDSAHFSRAFKAHFGYSPRACRASLTEAPSVRP